MKHAVRPHGIPIWNTRKPPSSGALVFPGSRHGYQHAIDEFVAWLTVLKLDLPSTRLRFCCIGFQLEERGLAPGTINVRMATVRRLPYEAASGLSSPELAVGIHRVKYLRKLESRLGNWLTGSEAAALGQVPDGQTRNRAILAILIGNGPRCRELSELTLESLQRREERRPIVDLVGTGRHIRTVPS